MNALKLIFGSFFLVILMFVVVPLATCLATVALVFMLMVENSLPHGGSFLLSLGAIIFSWAIFFVLLYAFERLLWNYWHDDRESLWAMI